MKFKKGDTVIYPQHGACIVQGTKKMEAFGQAQEYLILKTVINEALRRGLADADSSKRRPKTFRTRVFDAGAPLMPSLDNVAESLAAADGDASVDPGRREHPPG